METLYKNSGETTTVKHFQHLLGIAVLFSGVKDTDGDGIRDKEDLCSEVPGIILFKGCPDTDGDGIQDAEDRCPQLSGLIEFKGCPDTDGDGVRDAEDECPDNPGILAFKGCPDTDNDGVQDREDQCPEEAGTVENKGCLKITQQIIERLQEIGKIIYFAANDSELNKINHKILDEVFNILQSHSSYRVVVEGHTDSSGQVPFNQALSERRVNAVMRYLIDKGLAPSRISAKGFGETRPAESNRTAS